MRVDAKNKRRSAVLHNERLNKQFFDKITTIDLQKFLRFAHYYSTDNKMRKILLPVCVVALASSMLFTSCIGSFKLTNKVLSWNHQIGNKFVNELVFVGLWILPVY